MYLLIIESDRSIRKALRMGMAQVGWRIDAVCADIACITDMFSRHQYNIIIVDLDVKNRSILDSIGNVKKEQRQLIVVGITGGGVDEFFLEEDIGIVNACYQKPIHLNMLKKAIDLEFEKLVLV